MSNDQLIAILLPGFDIAVRLPAAVFCHLPSAMPQVPQSKHLNGNVLNIVPQPSWLRCRKIPVTMPVNKEWNEDNER